MTLLGAEYDASPAWYRADGVIPAIFRFPFYFHKPMLYPASAITCLADFHRGILEL